MTEALENALAQIAAVVQTVEGIKKVFSEPPSQANDSLFAVVYEQDWDVNIGPTGSRKSLYNINVDVLMPKTELARSFHIIRPYADLVSLALIREVSYDSDGTPGERFGNTIDTFESIHAARVPDGITYGNTPVFGYSFTLKNVKILVNL